MHLTKKSPLERSAILYAVDDAGGVGASFFVLLRGMGYPCGVIRG